MSKKILIVGAGPVGLSAALGLVSHGYEITLIDQGTKPTQDSLAQDQRMVALSHKSVAFLKELNVWSSVESYATPIDHVHVLQKGSRVEVEIDADECNVDHLGYLIPQGILVLEMYSLISQIEGVEYKENTTVIPGVTLTKGFVTLKTDGESLNLKFDWIIAADGVDSAIRNNVGIQTLQDDYTQAAVIARCKFEHPHQNIAYECFTEEGPLALLPFNTHEMAVVLTVPRAKMFTWNEASDLTYSSHVLSRFGGRLGDITEVQGRQIWPLTLMLPKELYKGCVMFIGNSAHGIHPIAGQGLNLGFRDSEMLIQLFSKREPSCDVLDQFFKKRRKDIIATVGATDFLVTTFGVKGILAKQVRTMGLMMVKCCPTIKRKIAMSGMGYIK